MRKRIAQWLHMLVVAGMIPLPLIDKLRLFAQPPFHAPDRLKVHAIDQDLLWKPLRTERFQEDWIIQTQSLSQGNTHLHTSFSAAFDARSLAALHASRSDSTPAATIIAKMTPTLAATTEASNPMMKQIAPYSVLDVAVALTCHPNV
jgi:hypothetical protein